MWIEYDETIFIESIPKPRYFYLTQKQYRFSAKENETKKKIMVSFLGGPQATFKGKVIKINIPIVTLVFNGRFTQSFRVIFFFFFCL